MEAVISNPKPFILIGSDEGAQRIGIDANMNLEIKGRAVPLDVLWELGDFLPGTTIEIPVIGLFFSSNIRIKTKRYISISLNIEGRK